MNSVTFANKQTLLVVLCVSLFAGGCQQQTASKLRGKWIGRPDTAAARAARDAERFHQSVSEKSSADVQDRNDEKTEWERFDVAVAWDFVSHETVEMSLADGSQALKGDWKIVRTSPIGCTVEILANEVLMDETLTHKGGRESGRKERELDNRKQVRRQFEIELDERDGKCIGFLLSEAGADRQLGTIYFHRPDTTKKEAIKKDTGK